MNFFIKINKIEFLIRSSHPNIFIIPARQNENNIETKWNQISQKRSLDFCQLDSLMCTVQCTLYTCPLSTESRALSVHCRHVPALTLPRCDSPPVSCRSSERQSPAGVGRGHSHQALGDQSPLLPLPVSTMPVSTMNPPSYLFLLSHVAPLSYYSSCYLSG